jgi:hypothetical protein
MVQPVDFEVVKPSKSFLHPQSFLKKLGPIKTDEANYCRQLIRKASRNRTRLHLLADLEAGDICGFIALSAATLLPYEDVPCIVVDYLLTVLPYRGVVFEELGNRRISEYLVDYAIRIAEEMNANVPFRYLALFPAHEKLFPLYHAFDFKAFDNSGWLFFKIAR